MISVLANHTIEICVRFKYVGNMITYTSETYIYDSNPK